ELAAQSISVTVIILFLTALQVLLGELVPKNIGIQYPEQLALLTTIPMRWSVTIFKPLIWFFNGSGQLLMRLFGRDVIAEHAHIHSPREIMMLVEESSAGGLIQQEERRLLKNTLEMRESMVRRVMIPRTRMMAAPDNLTCDELFTLLADSQYSRLPLYRGNIDNIVGVVHLKDLLCLGQQLEQKNVTNIMRLVPFVPETMRVKTVFTLLQRKHLQVAIILDEYGGTAGMVSLEDLIEEIFGELQDEFDTYIPPFRLMPDNRLWIRGDTLVEDLNEQLEELNLPDEKVNTVGGLALNASGHVPDVGEEIEIEGWKFRVEKMRGRGVAAVSLAVSPEQTQQLQEKQRD
ncbi:MAG: hemolysin family protein, partial [Anaerolineales bacterium]